MVKVYCNKCKQCTGISCEKYGANATEAVKLCAADNFVHYKVAKKPKGAIPN